MLFSATFCRCLGIHWVAPVTGELLQLLVINSLQLRAAERTNNASDSTCQLIQRAEKDVRLRLSRQLIEETGQIVTLGQICRLVKSTGQVGNVNTSERVGRPSVTTDVEEFGVKGRGVDGIHDKVIGFIRVFESAPVPVQWNLLSTLVGLVVVVAATDTKPRLNCLISENTLWVILSVVCHEAVDEGVRGGLHEYTSERSVEEVGVVLDLSVEAVGTEGGERVECDNTAWGVVDQILELSCDSLPVIACFVQVGSCRRGIAFVLVVRTDESVTQDTCCATLSERRRAAHRPVQDIAIDRTTERRQEEG